VPTDPHLARVAFVALLRRRLLQRGLDLVLAEASNIRDVVITRSCWKRFPSARSSPSRSWRRSSSWLPKTSSSTTKLISARGNGAIVTDDGRLRVEPDA